MMSVVSCWPSTFVLSRQLLQAGEERKMLQTILSNVAPLAFGRSNTQLTPKEAGAQPQTLNPQPLARNLEP